MILAAGLGKRMGSISDHTPKPLVTVGGRTLLDRALDHVSHAGLGPTAVNVHHLADAVEEHLGTRIKNGSVLISDERARLLETGGGIARAYENFLGPKTLVINSDALWVDLPAHQTLQEMWDLFDVEKMDILLCAVPIERAFGYEGNGDFFMENCPQISHKKSYKVSLSGKNDPAPYMFGGIMVVNTKIYKKMPVEPWSNRILFELCDKADRLFGYFHSGLWVHVGTPDAINLAEEKLIELDQG